MLKVDKSKIEQFKNDGVLLFRRAVNRDSYMKILDLAKVHLKYKIEPVETEFEYSGIDKEEYKNSVRRLRQVYDRDIIFKEWEESKIFCNYFKEILQDNPVLVTAHHNSIMTKLPKTSTETGWHRDIRYWSYENSNLVSVWLALGDEYLDNGVLEFIPGSHKMDLSRDRFDEKLYFREDLEENQELIDKKISFNLEAGDVVLFHSLTLHRAGANMTDKPKISFVYTVKGERNRSLKDSRSDKFKEIKIC
jgi:phytanoyl-CoA hydroxylase